MGVEGYNRIMLHSLLPWILSKFDVKHTSSGGSTLRDNAKRAHEDNSCRKAGNARAQPSHALAMSNICKLRANLTWQFSSKTGKAGGRRGQVANQRNFGGQQELCLKQSLT